MDILIVDDHEVFRRRLRFLLESRPDWHVCGEAADGIEAVEKANQLRPSVILMDVSMPRMNGVQATRIIRREVPESEVILVSQNEPTIVSRLAAEVDAGGYVSKNELERDLLPAIDAALARRPRESGAASALPNSTGKPPEKEVSESEQRFQEMLDALPAAIYTTDAEGRLTHFNRAAVELAGRTPELGSDSWCVSWKLFSADGTPLPHDQCPMAVALKEGKVLQGVELIVERPDGKRLWVTPYPRALHNADGKIVGGVNMLLDITERKLAEKATGLLAAIVAASDDAIISKNLDGMITSWNNSAERLFGYAAEEAIGQHITLIIPSDRWDEEAQILARLRSGERVDHFQTVRVRKDGTTADVSLTISPVRNSAGRLVGASKVARDISKERRAEEILRESEERFRKLSQTLDAEVRTRTRELEQRTLVLLRQSEQVRALSGRLLQAQDEERRRLARELHDSAGQILTVLSMDLERITHETEKNAPHLAKQAEEAQELVQRLNQELRTTSYLLHPPLLDESGLVSALSWYTDGLSERSGLAITLNVSEGFGRLPHDMELAIFRVVQECLTNIHRHSGSKTANIRIAREADMVTIEVQDQGRGMSSEKLAEIQSRGSGVGIRGMRERVHQFQGAVNVESGGTGTRIVVTIPTPVSALAGEPSRIAAATGGIVANSDCG